MKANPKPAENLRGEIIYSIVLYWKKNWHVDKRKLKDVRMATDGNLISHTLSFL